MGWFVFFAAIAALVFIGYAVRVGSTPQVKIRTTEQQAAWAKDRNERTIRATEQKIRVADLTKALPGGLRNALLGALQPDETILAALHMNVGEGIAATDYRVLILKAGGLYGSAGFFGQKSISYPYSELSSVEHREGIIGGHIKFLAAGVLESGSRAIQLLRNSRSENVVTYQSRRLRPLVRNLVRVIQKEIAIAHRPPSQSLQVGLAEQLGKLADLRSSGTLTEEEFIAAKARLISTG